MPPSHSHLYFRHLAAPLCALLLVTTKPVTAQTSAAPTPTSASVGVLADPIATYKDIDLKQLVTSARTEIPGQHVIFAPTAVRFRAVLAAMPAPQKTEYLQKALGMMGIGSLGSISQRIGIDFGGEKALTAYIDDVAASRISKEAKLGQTLQFYAYHVYNHARGPALVITSFNQ